MFPRDYSDFWNTILRSPDGDAGAAGGETPSGETPSGDQPGNVSDNFDGLDFGGETDDLDVVDVPVETPPDQPKTPEPKPQEPSQTPPAEVPAPSQTPEAPKPNTPPGQQETQPSPTPSAPEDPWSKFEKDKPAIIQNMAKTRYAMTKEEKEQLEAEPFESLPLLAAKVHTELFADVLRSVTAMLPIAFQNMQVEHSQNSEAVDEFQKAWPQIDMSAHGADVEAFARLYRQSNPNASKADAIKMVGAMVLAKHGIAASTPANPAPATPAAHQAAPAFRPAQPGVATVPPGVVAEEFIGLGQDHDD